MTATTHRLDARYGRTPERRRRRLLVGAIAVAVAVAAIAVWAVWTGVGGAVGTLQTSTISFTEDGNTAVRVAWEVDGQPGERLWCAVEAQDDSGAVVGLKEVLVPVTGSASRTGTTTVRIVRAATVGLIDSCRRA